MDRAAAETLLPVVCDALQKAGCEIRADEGAAAIVSDAAPATVEDWSTEYLYAIIAVRAGMNRMASLAAGSLYS